MLSHSRRVLSTRLTRSSSGNAVHPIKTETVVLVVEGEAGIQGAHVIGSQAATHKACSRNDVAAPITRKVPLSHCSSSSARDSGRQEDTLCDHLAIGQP